MSEQKRQTTDELLAERGRTHGEYSEHARCTQAIVRALEAERGWADLPDIVRESCHMIAHKLGRVVTGHALVPDHWDDIGGYAKLVSQRISSESTTRPGVLAEGHRPQDLWHRSLAPRGVVTDLATGTTHEFALPMSAGVAMHFSGRVEEETPTVRCEISTYDVLAEQLGVPRPAVKLALHELAYGLRPGSLAEREEAGRSQDTSEPPVPAAPSEPSSDASSDHRRDRRVPRYDADPDTPGDGGHHDVDVPEDPFSVGSRVIYLGRIKSWAGLSGEVVKRGLGSDNRLMTVGVRFDNKSYAPDSYHSLFPSELAPEPARIPSDQAT